MTNERYVTDTLDEILDMLFSNVEELNNFFEEYYKDSIDYDGWYFELSQAEE